MKSYFKHTVYCYPTEIINPDFKKGREEGKKEEREEERKERKEGK